MQILEKPTPALLFFPLIFFRQFCRRDVDLTPFIKGSMRLRHLCVPVNRVEESYKSVQVGGSNPASGVYFYRLDAGAFMGVKKLILLK